MSELVVWLRAQLDEDERVARAAAEEGAQWSPGGGSACAGIWAEDGPDPGFPVVYDEGRPLREQAAHIARHDPARVLREVAAKRAIVDEHELLDPPPDPDDTDWPLVCRRCEDRQRHDAMRWPCPTLRHLASVYVDRPGYREEWRA